MWLNTTIAITMDGIKSRTEYQVSKIGLTNVMGENLIVFRLKKKASFKMHLTYLVMFLSQKYKLFQNAGSFPCIYFLAPASHLSDQ